jgi:tetratricopeptide (TPR) repeat protein
MKNIVYIISFLFLQISIISAEQPFCSCHSYNNFLEINNLIYQYKEAARKNFLDRLPPYRKEWESEFHSKVSEINSKFCTDSQRYPDVYQNILLFSQKIDIVKDYEFTWAYKFYNGCSYSKAEKELRIARARERIAKKTQDCHQKIEECTAKIINEYAKLYEACLGKHTCWTTYHDYSLLAYLNNNFDKSLELLFKMMNQADQTGQIKTLDAAVYHNLGSVCNEAMIYDKAIEFLSEAIKRDPSNKEAHFDRAVAYFEIGLFDLAIEDYLLADKGKGIPKSTFQASKKFTNALLRGVCQGATEAAIEFFPSLCSSAYGLGEMLWAVNPLNSQSADNTNQFAGACYEMAECVVGYCKNIDWETMDNYVDQVKTLYDCFEQLNESEKGELIGYTIGKYGIDLFAGGTVVKSVSTYRKLRTANRICNLEAMTISKANKKTIVASSLKHASRRENYFKNVKIHWDKQNKHIPGKHNFLHGRGTITMESNEFEALTKKYVGKGQRVEGTFGDAGYVERLDFGKIIGEYAEKVNGEIKYTPTSKGIIKYAKDGTFHVIPSNPEAIIK